MSEPSKEDEHFAEQALKLARMSASAYEEAIQYMESIDYYPLREKIADEIDKITELL
jgi:hypothetical protein